ncbi:YnfA family protein [Rhizosaccharibacter radicis]|uniref:YnfA family protein n=1 Tax=Rhizosaccharibacter radicis TaxID=2782605 RepID=A0ABT1VWJ5_9PROT|nr:YnfA family protein [Acetobacteraceae bacterium KSS12]
MRVGPAEAMLPLRDLVLFALAAVAEIGGCFGVWVVVRQGRTAWWLLPSLFFLAAFALLLARTGGTSAGRSFAVYAGIYLCASLVWMRAAEGVSLTRWDLLGGAICLAGCMLILLAPRA